MGNTPLNSLLPSPPNSQSKSNLLAKKPLAQNALLKKTALIVLLTIISFDPKNITSLKPPITRSLTGPNSLPLLQVKKVWSAKIHIDSRVSSSSSIKNTLKGIHFFNGYATPQTNKLTSKFLHCNLFAV